MNNLISNCFFLLFIATFFYSDSVVSDIYTENCDIKVLEEISTPVKEELIREAASHDLVMAKECSNSSGHFIVSFLSKPVPTENGVCHFYEYRLFKSDYTDLDFESSSRRIGPMGDNSCSGKYTEYLDVRLGTIDKSEVFYKKVLNFISVARDGDSNFSEYFDKQQFWYYLIDDSLISFRKKLLKEVGELGKPIKLLRIDLYHDGTKIEEGVYEVDMEISNEIWRLVVFDEESVISVKRVLRVIY